MADVIVILFAYLSGSIPFGLLLTRLAKTEDIRTIGSGNIGATNVLRTGRKGLALATLFLDAAKGGVAVLLAKHFASLDLTPYLAACVAVLGHIFPVWLKFKGGKGVATALAAITMLHSFIGGFSLITWVIIFGIFRYSSLASVMALFGCIIISFFLLPFTHFLFLFAISGLVIWRHKDNILRLMRGEELQLKNN